MHVASCDHSHVATNVELNEVLLAKAMELGGAHTKKEAVNQALEEYVRLREQQKVTELFGKIEFDEAYDYKAQRKRS